MVWVIWPQPLAPEDLSQADPGGWSFLLPEGAVCLGSRAGTTAALGLLPE